MIRIDGDFSVVCKACGTSNIKDCNTQDPYMDKDENNNRIYIFSDQWKCIGCDKRLSYKLKVSDNGELLFDNVEEGEFDHYPHFKNFGVTGGDNMGEQFSDVNKAKHGSSAHDGMEGILKRCVDAGYLVQFTKNYGIGREGYKNQKQFYAPFMIVFNDETKWAIFTTNLLLLNYNIWPVKIP